MPEKLEKKYFQELKKEVASLFREDFSYVPEDPKKWKTSHISYFQEHLFQKTKGNFSDRWFYTYFKNDNDKIPRIDMLNILAKYAGYENWGEYVKTKNEEQEVSSNSISNKEKTTNSSTVEKTVSTIVTKPKKASPQSKKSITILVILVSVIISAFTIYKVDKSRHEYSFYFRDLDRFGAENTVYKQGIAIVVPSNTDSPRLYTDSLGRIKVFSREDQIKLYVNSPLYKKDTFIINLKNSNSTQMVLDLKPNDYAQMMYYYSYSMLPDVEKRRRQLNKLIAEDALIYQVFDNENYGQEVLSKQQYIALMTIPTESLKNYILIDTDEKNGKFTRIKFKIIPNEEQK